MDWHKITIAIVGGDNREKEIARCAAETGAVVRAYGFPWPVGGIAGVRHEKNAGDCFEGADFALFPIPGIASDGALFSPESAERIIPDESMLSRMRSSAHIILGWADPHLKRRCEALGIILHEYEWDVELMLLRGSAIIEGMLKVEHRIYHSQGEGVSGRPGNDWFVSHKPAVFAGSPSARDCEESNSTGSSIRRRSRGARPGGHWSGLEGNRHSYFIGAISGNRRDRISRCAKTRAFGGSRRTAGWDRSRCGGEVRIEVCLGAGAGQPSTDYGWTEPMEWNPKANRRNRLDAIALERRLR